jgi:membrane protein DedA with SNARE-associated domain
LGQLTTILEHLITNLYVSTGLLGIVLAMAIESCCIPLPSEIVMPLAGIMLYQHKILPGTNSIVGLLLVALAGSAGCLIGSTAAYWIGYKGGRPLMLKYGRYVLISQHDADLADKFFQRWGSATAFFSRLLPIVRTYISIPAGISKMPFVKFCIYTFLGSFPFCILLAYVGTILGNNLEKLGSVFHGLDAVVGVALVVLIALYIWRHVSNDRKARAAHAAQGGQDGQPPQQSGQAWGQPAQSQQQFAQMGTQQNSSSWGASQPSQPQSQQQWGQPQQPQPSQFQPVQQPGWNQQPPPQQWEQQPQSPQQPQQSMNQFQPMQQTGWGQQPQPQQQQWGQQPQQPQQSMNQFQPAQQGWGQQQPQPQHLQVQQPSQFQPQQFQPQQQQWRQQPQEQQWGQQQSSQFQPQQQGWGQQ